MNNEKRLVAIIIVLAIIAAALGGWAVMSTMRLKSAEEEIAQLRAQTPEPAATPEPAKANDSDAAAEFNGGTVTVGQAREEYGAVATYYYTSGMVEDEFAEELKMTVLQKLVEEQVLHAKAEELGLTDLSEAQRAEIEESVTAEYEDTVKYYSSYRYDESKTEEEIRSETVAYLNESGISYESMLAEAQAGAWRDALKDYAVKDAVIDDETLKNYYDVQLTSDELTYSASFAEYEADANAGRVMVWNPAGVRRIETVLIPFDEAQQGRYYSVQAELAQGNTEHLSEIDLLYDELQDKADEVGKKLADGADFEQMQNEYGRLHTGGTFVSENSTECGDDFRNAAMALKKGDISEAVHTDRGIAFLRYAEDMPEGAVPFEDIRDELRASYEDQFKQQVYADAVEKWMEEANVRYYPERM